MCCFIDAYPLPLAQCEVLLSGGLVNVEPPQPPTGQSRGNDFRVYAKDFRLLQRCLDPWLECDQIMHAECQGLKHAKLVIWDCGT